ncbi:MAG: hypothetical protein ACXWBN_03285 [Acidimicrobiales bacterium]
MAFRRDDALIEQLRRRPDNVAVLELVESASAHGDLGELLFDHAKATGDLRVVPLASADFPALVATPSDDDLIVAAAAGMRRLLLRAGDEPPEGARLRHEPVAEAGPGWWHVEPFDPEVNRAAAVMELRRWLSAACEQR